MSVDGYTACVNCNIHDVLPTVVLMEGYTVSSSWCPLDCCTRGLVSYVIPTMSSRMLHSLTGIHCVSLLVNGYNV